jgi:ADP-ribose pyrophosphatase YjhB (NUDIX family)
MEVHDTVAIVVEKEGKFLLIKRGTEPDKGKWAFPAGHMDTGEKIEQTAQREANEEIGNVVVEKEPLFVFVHDWPAGKRTPEPHQHRCHVFKATISGELRAGDDAAEIGWFFLREISHLDITNYTREIIKYLSQE